MKNDADNPNLVGKDKAPGGNKGETGRNWTPYLIGGIVGLLLVIFGMTNCWFGHSWNAATCTAPKTCADCGKTEGNAIGHSYTAATATAPKTCKLCGRTEGKIVETHTHSWAEATCIAPKHCTSCGETIGTVAAHQWSGSTCAVCGAASGVTTSPSGGKADNAFADLRIGDTVNFGEYEQDNNRNNGKEDIEWIVIDKSGEKVLLMSRLALDSVPYHSFSTNVTWEDCTLRDWLNDTFYNSAFAASEKDLILTTTVSADKNPDFPKVNPGASTSDKIYILSADEALYYFPNFQDRACTATKYTQAKGVAKCWWWLRTPGASQDTAASVNSNGVWDENGSDVAGTKGSVRPVLWVSTE